MRWLAFLNPLAYLKGAFNTALPNNKANYSAINVIIFFSCKSESLME